MCPARHGNFLSDADATSQKMIMGGFPGSTLRAIAHRLETVLDFDKIIALEHGRVKEVGAPKQLEDDPSSMFARVLAGAYRPPADPGRPQIRHIGGSQHTCAPCTVAVAAEQRDSETSTEDDSPNEASSRVESAAATWGDADQCAVTQRLEAAAPRGRGASRPWRAVARRFEAKALCTRLDALCGQLAGLMTSAAQAMATLPARAVAPEEC